MYNSSGLLQSCVRFARQVIWHSTVHTLPKMLHCGIGPLMSSKLLYYLVPWWRIRRTMQNLNTAKTCGRDPKTSLTVYKGKLNHGSERPPLHATLPFVKETNMRTIHNQFVLVTYYKDEKTDHYGSLRRRDWFHDYQKTTSRPEWRFFQLRSSCITACFSALSNDGQASGSVNSGRSEVFVRKCRAYGVNRMTTTQTPRMVKCSRNCL